MSQNLPVDDFNWVENLSEFDESFIKIIIKTLKEDIQIFSIQKNCMNLIMIYHFYQKE